MEEAHSDRSGLLLFVWNSFVVYLCLRCCLRRYNRDLALVELSFVEDNDAVGKSIKGVVLALRDVLTWEVLVATLANDDVAGCNLLSAPDFYT